MWSYWLKIHSNRLSKGLALDSTDEYSLAASPWTLVNTTATAQLVLRLGAFNATQPMSFFASLVSHPPGLQVDGDTSSLYCVATPSNACQIVFSLKTQHLAFESTLRNFTISIFVDPGGRVLQTQLPVSRELCPSETQKSPSMVLEAFENRNLLRIVEKTLFSRLVNRGEAGGWFRAETWCNNVSLPDVRRCYLDPGSECALEWILGNYPRPFECRVLFQVDSSPCITGEQFNLTTRVLLVVKETPMYYLIPIYVILGIVALLYLGFLISWITKLCTECGITRDAKTAQEKDEDFFSTRMTRPAEIIGDGTASFAPQEL